MKTIAIGGRTVVSPEEIILFVADINYTIVHYSNGKKCIVATTLKVIEEKFIPYQFYRVHKSYLVNLNFIKKFNELKNSLELSNNQSVMVSRRKRVWLRKHLHLL